MKIINSRKRGFTLIELLVVVSIIGLLASVVLASLNTARGKARDAKRRSELHQLAIALEFYYDKYGRYPVSAPNCGGQSGDTYCRDNQGTPTNNNWIPGLNEFMPTMPHNPNPPAAPGWVYHYYAPVGGTQYWLMTKLENLSSDTCGGGAVYRWLDNSFDWCLIDPTNNYKVYVIPQR